jgi:hypothetical protein
MGSWYWVGVMLGLGVGAGVVAAAVVGRTLVGIVLGCIVAAAIGVVFGLVFAEGTLPPIAGGVGGVIGTLGASQIVRGALRRGGTASGVAALVVVSGLLIVALAFVPVLGYLEAVAVPVLGVRVRRRSAERYAGLRTLAK